MKRENEENKKNKKKRGKTITISSLKKSIFNIPVKSNLIYSHK